LEIPSDIGEYKAVQKFLRVVPGKFRQMASSIQSFLDLKHMSIEELTGRLTVVEADEAEDGDSGKQLLPSSRGDHRQAKGRGKGRDDKRPVREGSNASGGVKQDDICRYCGKKGHWAHECRKKKREEAHPDRRGS
jgi:hypothetical protein